MKKVCKGRCCHREQMVSVCRTETDGESELIFTTQSSVYTNSLLDMNAHIFYYFT